MKNMKKKASIMLVISIALMLLSSIVASLVQTNFGHVTMKHLYWETEEGMSARDTWHGLPIMRQ